MTKRGAFLIAGVLTFLVMVLALGIAGGAGWLSQNASAAGAQDPPAATAAVLCVDPADVAALQAQVRDYQVALQQANTQLQAADDEITRLQTQRSFPGEREENGHEYGFFHRFDD